MASKFSLEHPWNTTTPKPVVVQNVHISGALIFMAVVTAAFSFLPLYIRRSLKLYRKQYEQHVLSGCLCFGAGVLLATVFLHLLPESEEKLEEHFNLEFPLGKLIFCSGFLFMYLTESVMHRCSNGEHIHNHEMSASLLADSFDDITKIHLDADSPKLIRKYEKRSTIRLRSFSGSNNRKYIEKYNKPSNNSILMVFALVLHGVMEGFAIGLETRTFDLWILVCAITSHKIFIAFSLGMQLIQQHVSLSHYIMVVTSFSLASPIGGAIGAVVEGASDDGHIPAIFQGLAGGLILYVVFFEILFKERTKTENDPSITQSFALILGFSIISILEYVKQT